MNETRTLTALNDCDLYSTDLNETDPALLSEDLRRAISYLELHPEVLDIYRIAREEINNEKYIFVAALVNLEQHLPPRYDPNLHGIEGQESIVFLFSEARYPTKAPSVGSDRKNFPWVGKLHIIQTSARWPTLFCLARVPIDDWFAEHSFPDFFDRAMTWLHDAARGRLQREKGRFEPTLTFSTLGCQFEYEKVATWIKKCRQSKRVGFHFVQFELYWSGSQDPAFLSLMMKYEGQVSARTVADYARGEVPSALGGLITWTSAHTVTDEHFSTLPGTRDELYSWAKRLGMPIDEKIEYLISLYEQGPIELINGPKPLPLVVVP